MRKCSASQGGVSITRENVYAETPTKTWGNPNAARMQRLAHPCVAAVNAECGTVWWFPINMNTQHTQQLYSWGIFLEGRKFTFTQKP